MKLPAMVADLTVADLQANPTLKAAVQDWARASRRVEWHRRRRPLALATLWHRPQPRTSQRDALRALLQPSVYIAFLRGGNRTGKTAAGAMWSLAMAQGRDHPDVARWIRENGLEPSIFPEGPGTVWAVARSFNDSRRYVRKALIKYAPIDHKTRSWDADNEATLTLPGGGQIICKAVAQKRGGFQGDAIRALWFDEEPTDKAVWDEAQMRLADQDGRTFISATPLLGRTWLMKLLVLERKRTDVRDVQLEGLDNPHVPPEALKRIYAGYGKHQLAARMRGDIVALEGRVFDGWARHLHMAPTPGAPRHWPRYASIDPGTRNPTAILLAAHDEDQDRLHILGEWYGRETTYAQRAAALRALEKKHGACEAVLCDPEDRGFRLELATVHGISTLTAPKRLHPSISAVASRLECPEVGSDGETEPPGLLVSETCQELAAEMDSYVWDPGGSVKGEPDRPLKRDDHGVDALRYLCLWLATQAGMGAT